MNPYLEADDEEHLAVVPEFDPGEPVAPVAIPVPPPAPAFPALVATGEPVDRGPFAPKPGTLADLEEAKAARDDADREALVAQGNELLNNAFGGTAKGLAAGARAKREDSFQDYMRRRTLEDQDIARQKETRTQALEAALARGDSPESVKAKDMFSSTTVGAELRRRMGEEAWARLPGSSIPGSKEMLASEVDLMKKQLAAKQGPADGDLLMKAAEKWYAMGDAPLDQKIAALRGMGLSEPAVKSAVLRLSEGEAGRRFQGGQREIQRGHDLVKIDIQQGNRLEENDRDKHIGGLDLLDPNHPPSASQQQNMAKITPDYKSMYNSILSMRDILRDKGPQALTGPEYTELKRAFGNALLTAKNVYGLGVLQKLDIDAIKQVIADPSALDAFLRDGDFLANLNSALAETANSFTDQATTNMLRVSNPHLFFTSGRLKPSDIPGYSERKNPSAGDMIKNFGSNISRVLGDLTGSPAPTPVPTPAPAPNGAPPLPTTTPVREPSGAVAPVPQPKTEVKRQRSKKTGQVKIIYSDGSEEIING